MNLIASAQAGPETAKGSGANRSPHRVSRITPQGSGMGAGPFGGADRAAPMLGRPAYVGGRGALDEERFRDVQDGARDLRRILPGLHGEDAVYVGCLIKMAELINDERRSAS